MVLQLTKNESELFFECIDFELRSVINEYDPDTRRCPSKKRIKDSEHAKSIIDKWIETQNIIPDTTFVNLDNINPCKLELADKEVSYSIALITKNIKDFENSLSSSPFPHFGVLKVIEDNVTILKDILRKLFK